MRIQIDLNADSDAVAALERVAELVDQGFTSGLLGLGESWEISLTSKGE
jgi:hypothetical protein